MINISKLTPTVHIAGVIKIAPALSKNSRLTTLDRMHRVQPTFKTNRTGHGCRYCRVLSLTVYVALRLKTALHC